MKIYYHYFPSTSQSEFNLLTFLNSAVIDEKNNYFINIVEPPSFSLPSCPHIRFLHFENNDADYGGLSKFIKNIYSKEEVDDLFVVNSSVSGPFFPPNILANWTLPFTTRLSETVPLVGASISFLPASSHHGRHYQATYGETGHEHIAHVQTFAFVVSGLIIIKLLDHGFFDSSFQSERDLIVSGYELRLSQLLLSWGYGISSLSHPSPPITLENQVPPAELNGMFDYMFPEAYAGQSLHPYECVFVKTRRYPSEYLKSLYSISSRMAILRTNQANAF